MNILICLLGRSPGVATGAYYAFQRDRGIAIDRLVTVTTDHPFAGDCEYEIEDELDVLIASEKVAYGGDFILPTLDEGNGASYEPEIWSKVREACRLRIPYEEPNSESSIVALRELLIGLLRKVYADDNVYLCVAGGRKSMAAVAAIAAQLYGDCVQGMYHLHVNDDIERDGRIDDFPYLSEARKRQIMQPLSHEMDLVNLPFFQFTVREGRPELTLRGHVQDFVLDYLATHEEFTALLAPQTRGRVLDYVFETQVAEALNKQGYFARPHFKVGKEDIVYASSVANLATDQYTRYRTGIKDLLERLGQNHPKYVSVSTLQARLEKNFEDAMDLGENENQRSRLSEIIRSLNFFALDILGISFNELCHPVTVAFCECEFYEDPTFSLEAEKVTQAAEYLSAMRQQKAEMMPTAQVQAWIVTNVETAEDDAWRAAARHDVQVMTTGTLADTVERGLRQGTWGTLLDENWITDEIHPM